MGTSGPTNGPGRTAGPQTTNLTPAQGVIQAEKRIGKPCYHAGQQVLGIFGCVACQFRINNRATLPGCPDCGEIVWAYMGDGPRPIPESGMPSATPVGTTAGPVAEDNVSLVPSTPPTITVEDGINLEI
ncbi:MAG: hypothetical protein EXQ74_01010 [Thermoleophilia bacterium]|nr:hypothetical protein [Thermoleophilia bacterium]